MSCGAPVFSGPLAPILSAVTIIGLISAMIAGLAYLAWINRRGL
jgi:hypothetical protein